MPRRFAVVFVALLALLAAALFAARYLKERPTARRPEGAQFPTPRPTPVIPPTPLPAQRVVLYFESAADERLHPEARDLPAMTDDIALLRSIGSAVLEGPKTPGLLEPFPPGWHLRAAYRLKDGLAALDLAPPPRKGEPEAGPAAPATKWETGSSEELSAVQTLIVSVTKNLPGMTHFVVLIGGEPAETLAGHLDLSHPLLPDLARVADEPAAVPPPPGAPSPPPSPSLSPPPVPSPGPSVRSRAVTA